MSDQESLYRLGSSVLEAASALPLRGGLGHPGRLARFFVAILHRPRRGLALIRLVMHTRAEYVCLSDARAGQALRRYFNRRFLVVFPQNRLCRGVLLLPGDHREYLRGRRRQALRTNLRRAASAGMRCELTSDPARALDAASQIMRDRRGPVTEADLACLTGTWPVIFARPETTLMIASDAEGRPRAIMAAVIDTSVCLIDVAVASSHDARWALHDHLVRKLIDRGVCYLLAEGHGPFGALGFEPNMREFQRLLGYELRHLVPAGADQRCPPLSPPRSPCPESWSQEPDSRSGARAPCRSGS